MKKIWFLLIGGTLLLLSPSIFAANVSQTQVKEFSTKLENHKNKLLKTLDESKVKLKKVSTEAAKFADTSLFRAASCLGAIPAEDQNLNFDKLADALKTSILNEYIKFDGDIKRLGFGMAEQDPLIFGNTLDTFYNQQALKISSLESDYYLKTEKVKKTFLEYVENNKTLLTSLAQNLDYLDAFQKTVSGVTVAFNEFKATIDSRSELFKAIEKEKSMLEKSFSAELESIFNQALVKNKPDDATQAKYLIHKDNFLKKFTTDIQQSEYYLFSALFSYADYADIMGKKSDLEKKFYSASWAVNCNLLLTTSANIGGYIDGTEAKAEQLKRGLKTLTDAIKNGRLNLKMLEEPALSYFKDTNAQMAKKLQANFRAMLDSETPQSTFTWNLSQTGQQVSSEGALPVQKVTFTQSFNKGQYHEQIKTLQTVLKNRGYYHSAIDGVYSPATIEAVYQFQLKEGIVTGKEKNKAGHGWFGQKTREKLNSLL